MYFQRCSICFFSLPYTLKYPRRLAKNHSNILWRFKWPPPTNWHEYYIDQKAKHYMHEIFGSKIHAIFWSSSSTVFIWLWTMYWPFINEYISWPTSESSTKFKKRIWKGSFWIYAFSFRKITHIWNFPFFLNKITKGNNHVVLFQCDT
jgi:hypothetical protein